MVIAEGESPYKKGKAYSKSLDSDVQLLDVKLSIAGLSGLASGSIFSGRPYEPMSTRTNEENNGCKQ